MATDVTKQIPQLEARKLSGVILYERKEVFRDNTEEFKRETFLPENSKAASFGRIWTAIASKRKVVREKIRERVPRGLPTLISPTSLLCSRIPPLR